MIDDLQIPSSYKNFLSILLHATKEDKRIENILLFGSCARGTLRAGSDIDIAILTKDGLSKEEELSFYDYLLDIDPKDYIACDLLVMPKEHFEEYKNMAGYIQKYIYMEGVDLYGSIRASD